MLQADFDPGSGLVAAFLDDDDPLQPYRATGAPIPEGAVLQRVNVRTVWPDPYLPQLPELLGPAQLDWQSGASVGTGALTRTFPLADYSPDAVRGALANRLDGGLRAALSTTDWSVIRRVETGQPIPPELARQRHDLRAWHADAQADLQTATPAELLSFDTMPPAEVWNPAELAQVNPTPGGPGPQLNPPRAQRSPRPTPPATPAAAPGAPAAPAGGQGAAIPQAPPLPPQAGAQGAAPGAVGDRPDRPAPGGHA